MARLGTTLLEDLPTFGRRLMELAREKEIGTPTLLAEALYENHRELVEPAQRKNKNGKNVKDRKHDIDAITRMVQNHFNEEFAYNIQSKYLFAYSELFNCSLDYLYGKVSVRSTDPDMNAVCEKTGLSEKAVEKLIRHSKLYLEGFLYQHYEYDFLYSDIDPEAAIDATRFWNDIIESDFFISIPEAWSEMACALQLHKSTREVLEVVTAQENTLPSRDDFFSLIDEYYATHDHDPCFGDDPYDIYDNDPERALEILKEMLDEKRYNAGCDADKSKTAYWGCVGLFDRLLCNYFHDMADQFQIPVIKEYLDNE